MQQILHIFRKDVRRYWPDVLVVLGILAAYAWHEVGEWHPREPRSAILHDTFLQYLPFLAVLGWAFLIARVVFAESLVGDREFWITRPYEWQKLLSAKVLYFLAFFSFPLLLIQVFLLWKAGFSPVPHVMGLLLLALWWASLIVLPVMTLAVLTANMVQFCLAVLGIAVSIIAIGILSTRIHHSGSPLVELIPDWTGPALLIAASITIIIVQYAWRRTLQARLLFLSVGLATIVIPLALDQEVFVPHRYTQSSPAARLPMRVSFDPTVTNRGIASLEDNKIPVRIPLIFSDIPESSAVSVDGATVDIDGPEQLHWNSGWFSMNEQVLAPGKKSQLSFAVDKPVFERVKAVPVTLHIWLASTGFRVQDSRRVIAGDGDFEALGNSICSIWPGDAASLHCRAPLSRPSMAVTVLAKESTCPVDDKEPVTREASFSDWEWNRDPSSIEMDLTPVQSFTFTFWRMSQNIGDRHFLCPGTPITFETLREAQRMRNALTIEGIRLSDYQPKQPSGGGTGFGIVSVAH
jgi:hypothetical protein